MGAEMTFDCATAYYDEARRSFRGHKRLAEGAFAQLSDEEFFRVIDPEANSVALIVKHMVGNMRSRFTDFLTSDGEKPDRNRGTEFEMTAGTARGEVMDWWERGWKIAFDALASLRPEDIGRTITIRGEPHTVLQAINRQVAHYAYHTGQIVFLAKHLKSSEWKSLSIPRGQSQQFNAKAGDKYKPPA
jgi:uncharacterized damage-inducible protein DinB